MSLPFYTELETSRANQWTGFYMITASVMKDLNFLTLPNLRFVTTSTINYVRIHRRIQGQDAQERSYHNST